MSGFDWSQAVIGLGIFLLALRLLHSIAGRGTAFIIKPIVDRILGTPVRSFLVGTGVATIYGSETVAVLGAMGLANASLISFEQAFFWMLGAGAGGVLAALHGSHMPQAWLFGLMAFLGCLLLFFRRVQVAGVLEILLALCLAGIGMDQAALAFQSVAAPPIIQKLLSLEGGDGFLNQIRMIGSGWMTGLMLSPVDAMQAAFRTAKSGGLSLEQGSLFILGTHFAMPMFGLLACLEFRNEGRRLSLTWLGLKFIGITMAWFFEPGFLALVGWASPWFGAFGSWAGLYASHACFALASSITFGIFCLPILRFLNWCWQPLDGGEASRPPLVLRMLASSPERAIREAQYQHERLKILVKELFDDCLQLMTEPAEETRLSQRRRRILRSWQSLYRGARFLMLEASTQSDSQSQDLKIRRLFRDINELDQLFTLCMKLHEHLDHHMSFGRGEFPMVLREQLGRLKPTLADLWVLVLAGRVRESEVPLVVQKGMDALDKQLLELLYERKLETEDAGWIHQALGDLRKLIQCLSWQLAYAGSDASTSDSDKNPA